MGTGNQLGRRAALGLLGLALAAAPASAEDASLYDSIWKRFRLYENRDNPTIQNVLLSGRFQLDYARVDADEGDHDEWNIRRFRFGAKAQLFQKLTVHGEVELNPQERDPLYVRVTDLYLEWRRNDQMQLTVGKHAAPFTIEGATRRRKSSSPSIAPTSPTTCGFHRSTFPA